MPGWHFYDYDSKLICSVLFQLQGLVFEVLHIAGFIRRQKFNFVIEATTKLSKSAGLVCHMYIPLAHCNH